MSDIRFQLADLTRPETLPAVCVRCGRPASGFRGMRLTSTEPRPTSFWGYLLWELGWWSWNEKTSFENLLHELQITKGRLKLPVCRWHRWIAPPQVAAELVGQRTVVLLGVGDGFVAAMKKQGKVRQ
jgi:hypothetical protein